MINKKSSIDSKIGFFIIGVVFLIAVVSILLAERSFVPVGEQTAWLSWFFWGRSKFDFSVSVNPGSGIITPSNSLTVTVSANLLKSPAKSVSFSAQYLPKGVSAKFNPKSCKPTCSTQLIFTANLDPQQVTDWDVVIKGSGGGETKYTSFKLTVSSGPRPIPKCTEAKAIVSGGRVNFKAYGENLNLVESKVKILDLQGSPIYESPNWVGGNSLSWNGYGNQGKYAGKKVANGSYLFQMTVRDRVLTNLISDCPQNNFYYLR